MVKFNALTLGKRYGAVLCKCLETQKNNFQKGLSGNYDGRTTQRHVMVEKQRQ